MTIWEELNPAGSAYDLWWIFSNGDKTITRDWRADYYQCQNDVTLVYSRGKRYVEILVGGGSDSYGGVAVGAADNLIATLVSQVGVDQYQWAYLPDGTKMNNNSATSFGASWGPGDVIGIAHEYPETSGQTGKVWFSKNGVWQGSGDPANGTNPAFTGTRAWGCYVTVSGQNYSGISYTIRGTQAEWDYLPPSGFNDWEGDAVNDFWDVSIDFDILAYGGIGLAEQVYEESLSFDMLAGFTSSRFRLVEDSIPANILIGEDFSPTVERNLSFAAPIKSKLEDFDLFNYSSWFANVKHLTTLKYYLTLKNNAGDEGVDVPMIDFNMTIRGENYSFITTNISYQSIDAILQNTKLMEVSFVYFLEGSENLRVKLFDGEIERINFNQYRTISLTSWFRFHTKVDAQNFNVERISLIDDGVYKIRIVNPDPFMRPGDQITDEEENTYIINVINYSYGPGYFISEIISNG